MIFYAESRPIHDYLRSTEAIDHADPKIIFVAGWLMDQTMRSVQDDPENIWPDPEIQLASLTYAFVRDRISYSADHPGDIQAWQASDVLEKREGLCYGKSHLLAALLRSNGIPAGICYQYLRLQDKPDSPLVLHSLNAVFFRSLDRWIRLDARGNQTGIDAQFSIEQEQIAYPVRPGLGETDLPLIFADVDRAVLVRLKKYDKRSELMAHLPSRLSGESD